MDLFTKAILDSDGDKFVVCEYSENLTNITDTDKDRTS